MAVRKWLGLALACALLAGCTKVGTGSDSSGRHPWTKPGVLRIGIQNAPNTLNPLLAGNTTESMINRLMFDPLVSVDARGAHDVPILAKAVPTVENGGISKDGLTITYHLRETARWHDGVPLTSKDVKFTWSAILNPNNNVIAHTGYELVREVDTPDPYTVVFHMKQKFSPAIDTIFGESDTPYEILPEHILGKLHNINNVPFNSAPVGSGPFVFKEWARGDHLTLVANPHYFLGPPKLKQIVIKFIPDENTELSQLRTHDLDWQYQGSPDQYAQLRTIPDVRIVLKAQNQYERIEMNNTHAPLDDVRLRRAIAYAIDSEKLVRDLTFGSATAADQDLPPFMWAHYPDVARYPYNPSAAKALLAQAGWTPGRDGILQRDGHRLVLTMVTNNSNVTRRAAVVQVQSMLREVGIALDVKYYLGELLFASVGQGGILQNGKFDLSWNGWVAGIDPDQSSLFQCSARPPRGNNTTFYCNPHMDAAQQAALENYDRPTRKKAYETIETLLSRDEPQIAVWWPRQIQTINPDFKNFTPNPVTESWNAYTWDI